VQSARQFALQRECQTQGKCNAANGVQMTTIGIVGTGIAGLTAAWHFQRAGQKGPFVRKT
jgi:hypothetical protein